MTSKLTREETQQIIDAADAVITALAGTNDEVHKDDNDKMIGLWDDLNDRYAPPEVVRELARMALAAIDSEPAATLYHSNGRASVMMIGDLPLGEVDVYTAQRLAPEFAAIVERLNLSGYEYENGPVTARNTAAVVDILLQQLDDAVQGRNTQPAQERDQVRSDHAEWSQATFGDVGPVGPLKHLSKEALEAVAEPGDLSEWADMQFLLWDAQRRAGITDEQITQAMIEKLAVNKQREWPEPKDGEPRLHIKEQPAPVVMDDTKLRELFDSWFASDCSFDLSPEASEADNIAWRESYWYVWQRCRTAMLNGGKS